MGGVPIPAQTLPNNSSADFDNSPLTTNHSPLWESDQFAAGLEPLFNAGALFEDPFGSAGGSASGDPGAAGYADDDGLSLLGSGWQGSGADSSGSAGGHDSTAGVEGSSPYSPLGNGLDNGVSAPPVFPSGSSQPTLSAQPGAQEPNPKNQIPSTNGAPPASQGPNPKNQIPSTPTPNSPAPTQITTWSSPVLDSVWRFGPAGHGRLLIQGSLQNTAPLNTQVPLDFYAKDPVVGNSWWLGSKDVTQTQAGSINFTVDLPTDVAPGTWICAEVHGRPDASGAMPSGVPLPEMIAAFAG